MIIIYIILFSLSYLCLLHSYILFPFILKWISKNKNVREPAADFSYKPRILILLPVHNEENTIYKTLEYLVNNEYPKDLYNVVIGSDASTDSTHAIVNTFVKKWTNFQLYISSTRRGKPNILNELVHKFAANYDYLLFLDSGALVDSEAITHLMKNFKNPEVGIVAANFKYKPDPNNTEVAFQEMQYIDRENEIKNMESLNWGSVMGVFGACYAVRKSLFKPFPSNFIVEDFYITMHVLKNGYKSIYEPRALVMDYNNSTMQSEFIRKVRISSGNFQNLTEYFELLWQRGWGVGFSFLSHKVLRWLGPFFVIIMMLSSAYLALYYNLFFYLFFIQLITMCTPIIDLGLNKLGFQFYLLRNVSYFYFMNFALLIGFFKYLIGVRHSVWQPMAR